MIKFNIKLHLLQVATSASDSTNIHDNNPINKYKHINNYDDNIILKHKTRQKTKG